MTQIELGEKKKEYEAAIKIVEDEICSIYRMLWPEPEYMSEVITSRVKTSESIEKKLEKKSLVPTLENAVSKLNDIAGVRCICPYVDELYKMAERIKEKPEFELIKEKDFIKKPKKSGYRSLHLILGVPVRTPEGEKQVKVEVQLRTQVMHLWARLEHKKIYKGEKRKNRRLRRMLERCAELGGQMDEMMAEIHKKTAAEMNLH